MLLSLPPPAERRLLAAAASKFPQTICTKNDVDEETSERVKNAQHMLDACKKLLVESEGNTHANKR